MSYSKIFNSPIRLLGCGHNATRDELQHLKLGARLSLDFRILGLALGYARFAGARIESMCPLRRVILKMAGDNLVPVTVSHQHAWELSSRREPNSTRLLFLVRPDLRYW